MSWFKRDPDGPPPYSPRSRTSRQQRPPEPPSPVQQHSPPQQQSPPEPLAPPPSAPTQASSAALAADPLDVWACITLSRDDRLRLINFPLRITDVVRTALNNAWAAGIKSETDRTEWGHNTFEFRLHGCPWMGEDVRPVPSKRLMCHLLHVLSANGWHLAVATDLSRKDYDKDTLMFRSGPPVDRKFFVVTFNEWDKVRLIDSPDPQVQLAFLQAAHGVQKAREKEPGCYQFKLRGYPWLTSDGQEVMHGRIFAMRLLAAFDQLGYELYANMDMNSYGSSEENGDVDCWFFASKI